ncbi:MAG: ABC transporter permease [Lachnospiraceae bacterium]|nr:ABC transporter permease [Lachnospiraceae bacterium]MCI1327555.1 ABC transporter permease [Lachnospiraceae bacterium]
MGEHIRFAIRGIWSHKLRSFLTMLGVIIGIASIIAIVSAIKGTNDQIMKNLIGAGSNAVTVSLRQGSDSYDMSMGMPQGVSPLSDSQKEQIRSIDGAEDASFYYTRSYLDSVRCGTQTLDMAGARGIDSHYLSASGYETYQGRPFSEKDFESARKIVLLDQTAAESLCPGESAVGKVIEVSGEPFTVVGVIRRADGFKPVINSYQDYVMYNEQDFGTICFPDSVWPVLFQFDEPENCVIRAKETKQMSRVGREAAEIMNQSVQSGDGGFTYQAEDLVEKARDQQNLSKSTNNLLIWIASIALLVGGIGVMNIMLVSVTERTSEIGLKKALGAKKKTILLQFLTESAMLTSIGGVIGVISGLILAKVISAMSGTPTAVSVPAIIVSFAFSMLIGILFGLLPSVKAANLNPIDALRRE